MSGKWNYNHPFKNSIYELFIVLYFKHSMNTYILTKLFILKILVYYY